MENEQELIGKKLLLSEESGLSVGLFLFFKIHFVSPLAGKRESSLLLNWRFLKYKPNCRVADSSSFPLLLLVREQSMKLTNDTECKVSPMEV